MAFAGSLTDLKSLASCPICLDYLRDPVTTECGHNFCCSCIHQSWVDLQDLFPCPVCLHQCPEGNLRRNTQLCNMTDFVKQIPSLRSKEKWQEEKSEKFLCEKHHQMLDLFSEKDLELLCPQCRISWKHWEEDLIPIEQAATSHRRKLKSFIEPLMKYIDDAGNGLEIAISKLVELRDEVEKQKSELYSEFEQCMRFLGNKRETIHFRLLDEKKNMRNKLIENKIQISEHMFILKEMLFEVTKKCVQADLDLLTGIGSIHNRYEHLKKIAVFSYELKMEWCNFLPKYLSLTTLSIFKANLTLDSETAHHDLSISEDKKTVVYRMRKPRCLHDPTERILHLSVLSCEGFDSGRHFWQVEVTGIGEWSLGVCKESFLRNTMASPSPNNGCWNIQLVISKCISLESVNVRQVGIFLDYELGELSFYNLHNRSHLNTFIVTSEDKLMPYFSVAPFSNFFKLVLS